MTDRPARIFLVGFMGAGKSSVAIALAQRLGWEAIDTDSSVEVQEGCSIEQIFRERGEGSFRRAEWEVLIALAHQEGRVIATGGGVFACADHRRWIRAHGVSVWLDSSLAACATRVGTGAGRPRWQAARGVGFRAFFEKRRAIYALADYRIGADRGSPEEVADRVLHRLADRLPTEGR